MPRLPQAIPNSGLIAKARFKVLDGLAEAAQAAEEVSQVGKNLALPAGVKLLEPVAFFRTAQADYFPFLAFGRWAGPFNGIGRLLSPDGS